MRASTDQAAGEGDSGQNWNNGLEAIIPARHHKLLASPLLDPACSTVSAGLLPSYTSWKQAQGARGRH